MPLSPEQEALCDRLEKGEGAPAAAALIRQQANEVDDLWDRLSRAYALVRHESPSDMFHEEVKELRAMLEGRGRDDEISIGRIDPTARKHAMAYVLAIRLSTLRNSEGGAFRGLHPPRSVRER
jgi:hypothetical protein